MSTPTREQIEAEFSAFIEYPSEDKRYVTTASCLLFAEHIARIAHTAGREQGLREAKEVCESFAQNTLSAQSGNPSDLSNVMLRQVAELGHNECAAAIEQLRGK